MSNFHAWLEDKGGIGNQEDKQAINQVRLFFEKYGMSRFQLLNEGTPCTDRMPFERAGYRSYRNQEPIFYVFKNYFDDVIAKGLDPSYVKKVLKAKGYLETDSDENRIQKTVKIAGRVQKMIVINSKILGDFYENI